MTPQTTAVCDVCARRCTAAPGAAGFCGARVNRGGHMEAENYGRITALALDPVEKKPLAHFYPGHTVLSVGSYGCNMDCPFCQNHEISRCGNTLPHWQEISPQQLAALAAEYRPQGNIGLAFTYNEPAMGWEFVRDASREAKALGLKTVMVTNGCFSPWVMDELLPSIDAFNIDLKCFSKEGYRRLGGDFAFVTANIEKAAATAHVEVTTLVVPGLSDSAAEMRAEAEWLAALSPKLPLHISRYFPHRNASAPPTSPTVMHRLHGIASKVLAHVHLGNL